MSEGKESSLKATKEKIFPLNQLPNEIIALLGSFVRDEDKINFEVTLKRIRCVLLEFGCSLYYNFGREDDYFEDLRYVKMLDSSPERVKKIKNVYGTERLFSKYDFEPKRFPS